MLARKLVVLALLVFLTIPYTSIAQQQNLFINVNFSSLRFKIFDDGSVKVIYASNGSLVVSGANLPQAMFIVDYSMRYDPGNRITRLNVTASLESSNLEGRSSLVADFSASFFFNPPGPSTTISVAATYSNETTTVNIHVSDAQVYISGGIIFFHATVSMTGISYDSVVQKLGVSSPQEVNQELRSKGLDFITIDDLHVVPTDNGAKIYVAGKMDVNTLLGEAVKAGMSGNDAEQLRKLLSTTMNYKASARLRFVFNKELGSLSVELQYYSTESGNISHADKVFWNSARFIGELMDYLAAGAVMESSDLRAYRDIAAMETVASSVQLPQLQQVAPTTSTARIEIEVGGSRASFAVRYESPRLIASPRTGNQTLDAARTLKIISTQLSGLRSDLSRYSVYVPGLQKLLPPTVIVETSDKLVTVSKTHVPLSELGTLKVKIKAGLATTSLASSAVGKNASSRTVTAGSVTPSSRPASSTISGASSGTSKNYITYFVLITILAAIGIWLLVRFRRA